MSVEKKQSAATDFRQTTQSRASWIRPVMRYPAELHLPTAERSNYTIRSWQDHPGLVTRALRVD